MEATEPMTMEQAIDAMIQPEEQPVEEVVEETESQSDVEDTAEPDDEQPEEDSEDEGEEVEDTADDAEEESEDDTEEEAEAEDSEDEVAEPDDEEPEALHTVKVDGVEEQVTLDQLKQSYSGQKYVQQKMQENAEKRKEVESVFSITKQKEQQLNALIAQAQQGGFTPPVEPDANLMNTDPVRYMNEQHKYTQDMQKYQQTIQQYQLIQQQNAAADAEVQKRFAEEQAQVLKSQLPELSDPKKATAFKERLVKTAEHFGFSAEEFSQIRSAREMMILAAAAKTLDLESKGKIVREKRQKARPKVKPGAKKSVNKTSEYAKKLGKLRKSGADADALALLIDPNLK